MQDFQAIRQQLVLRSDEIRCRLEKITREVRHLNQPLNADFAEQAVEAENDQVLDALESSIRAEMEQIEQALARMTEGTYGFCDVCGMPIAPGRLEALPYALRCIRCEEQFRQ